jgi:hypothetical protein
VADFAAHRRVRDRAALAQIASMLCPARAAGHWCGWCERPDDKIVLTPSQRRPLRRDLERLIERWRR